MKRFLAIILVTAMAVSLFGCKSSNSKKTENNADKKQTQAETRSVTAVDHSNEARSFLTGEWVAKNVAQQRPAAVMISNQPEAPQPSGISKAKVFYEMPAEGNYSTRIMGLFEDYGKVDKIGSIRSCRNAYVYFMLEFDAIYVHAGQSMPALELVTSDYVDNISTMDKDFYDVFFQTDDLQKPHNTFTSGEGILKGAKTRGYSLTHSSEFKGSLKFNENDDSKITLSDGDSAKYVYPGYSINRPYFEYNSSDGKYYRYQYKKGELQKHIDADTKEQVSVDNIIMQYCDFSNYLWDGEETLYWDITLKGSGKGKYITGGKAIDITWKKTSEFGTTHYYDSKGKELTINQGKTWVCIINNAMEEHVMISSTDQTDKNEPAYNPPVAVPETSQAGDEVELDEEIDDDSDY